MMFSMIIDSTKEGEIMAKMMPPPDGLPKVRVVEINEDTATDVEIEALSVGDFATRDGDDDKGSPPAPVRTVDEDDIPDPGKVWFRVEKDGSLKRWKLPPAER